MSVVDGVLATVLVAGVLSLLASPLLYRGLTHRRRYRRFRNLSVETPGTATPGETALVTGTARETQAGHITAPVSESEAVLSVWDIHSLRRYPPLDVRYVWAPEALGVDTNGFEISGSDGRLVVSDWSRTSRIEGRDSLQLTGTGQLPVKGLDVADLWVELEAFDVATRVLPGNDLPDHLQQLASRVDFSRTRPSRILPAVPRIRTPEGTVEFREWAVDDGEQLTILGTVTDGQRPDELGKMSDPDEYPALISSLEPDTLLRRYRWSYWKSVYGLGFLILGTASLVGAGVALPT